MNSLKPFKMMKSIKAQIKKQIVKMNQINLAFIKNINKIKSSFVPKKSQNLAMLGICSIIFLGCTDKYYEMYKSPCACLDKKEIQHIQEEIYYEELQKEYIEKLKQIKNQDNQNNIQKTNSNQKNIDKSGNLNFKDTYKTTQIRDFQKIQDVGQYSDQHLSNAYENINKKLPTLSMNFNFNRFSLLKIKKA